MGAEETGLSAVSFLAVSFLAVAFLAVAFRAIEGRARANLAESDADPARELRAPTRRIPSLAHGGSERSESRLVSYPHSCLTPGGRGSRVKTLDERVQLDEETARL